MFSAMFKLCLWTVVTTRLVIYHKNADYQGKAKYGQWMKVVVYMDKLARLLLTHNY